MKGVVLLKSFRDVEFSYCAKQTINMYVHIYEALIIYCHNVKMQFCVFSNVTKKLLTMS